MPTRTLAINTDPSSLLKCDEVQDKIVKPVEHISDRDNEELLLS